MPFPEPPEAAALARSPAENSARLEKRLAFVCALLLCASVFLLLGRGWAAHGARLGLLLFPVVGGLAWLFLPAARARDASLRRDGLWLSRRDSLWLWVGLPLLGYFLTSLAGMLAHGDPAAVLDKPVRMLMLAAGLWAWLHLRMSAMVFRHVVVVCSVFAGPVAMGVALYERFALGIERVGITTFPIQFADMTMALALICAVWVAGLPNTRLRWLAAGAAALSLAACWMALSRGAFAALVMLPAVLAYAAGRRLTPRRAAAVAGAVALALAVGLAASPRQRDRMAEALTDLQSYTQGDAATSLGMRLQMWDNSLRVFASSPVLGVGLGGYLRSQERGVAEGRLDPAILIFNGAHNQFIDALAKGGLLHGLSTVALFLFPWLWFRRQCRRPDGVPLHAVAGYAVASAFPLFALTQHVLNHGTGAMFYAGGVVLFALAARPQYGTMTAPTREVSATALDGTSSSTAHPSP